MQILHPFTGSIQQYLKELSDPNRYRPDHCPQCQAKPPLAAHGFYHRTLVDLDFDGDVPVRRYRVTPASAPFLYCRNSPCPSCASVFPSSPCFSLPAY